MTSSGKIKKIASKDGKEFAKESKKMLGEINESFKKLLSSLYSSDITDTDAEMKVLNTMLKSDGFSSLELEKEDHDE